MIQFRASSTQGSHARSRATRCAFLGAAFLCVAGARPASAQTAADSAHGANTVFRRSDLRAALTFAAAGVALLPLDTRITSALRAHPHGAGTTSFLNAVNHAAFPGAYVLGYSVYGLGLLSASESVTRVGLYTATSVIASSHLTDALKGVVGRARPWAAAKSDEFNAGRGFSSGDWTSFPSGHATVAFAAATAFVDGSRLAWPHEPRFVAPLAYGLATSVAVARVYGQAHWASDVVAGAAVGTFTARFIVREGHKHPGNLLEKIAVHGALGVDNRGRAMLGWRSQGQ